ncbi:hypothetical protein U1Q18_030969 [Sarracenia purpurea var. burkii]
MVVVLLEINPETSRFSRRKDYDPDQLSHRRPPPHTSVKPSTSARRWFESSPRRLTSRRLSFRSVENSRFWNFVKLLFSAERERDGFGARAAKREREREGS